MWTDVTNLKVTELNSTSADILIGFYPYYHKNENFGNAIAHAYAPGRSDRSGDIHMSADDSYSAFSVHGREFKMHCLFKVVCLSMCLCLLACLSVCMSVCVSFRGVSLSVCCVQWRAEAVGCPGPTTFLDALENIFYSSRKISDDLFYQLSNFRTTRSLDALCRAASCPGNDIFLFIFCHLPTFFTQNWPFGYPQGGCPGRRTVRTPSTRHWLCPSICLSACMSACMFIYAYMFICLFVCLCLSGCLFCLSTHI